MRIAALVLLLASLAACSNYQQPRANCFSLLPMEDGGDCTFTPLGGRADG